MDEFTIYGIALVPVITGMVQLLKMSGLPKKYTPFMSLLMGVLAGFYYLAPDDPPRAVFLGVIVGLSAVGLYSGTKNTMEGFRNNHCNYKR
ncbi:MAG: hypothetical protein AB1796_08915 [Bacillota bacterium]